MGGKMKKILNLCILLMLLFCFHSYARIKLVALPERENVIIRLDNPYATIVEEERILSLQKGINKVDFSWKGVNIDPDSICLKIISHPESVNLLSVSYPPEESALVWEIYAPEATQEKVRISYLLSGIDALTTYKLLVDKEEKKIGMKSFLVIRNFSGEDFVKGNFILGYGNVFETSSSNEETKQMLLFEKNNIPFKKVFTFDAGKLPWDPKKVNENVGIPVTYEIENSSNSGLGEFSLKEGKARIFQEDSQGSTIFLGEDMINFTPKDKKFSLYTGDSRDIVVTQYKMKDEKINIRKNSNNDIILYDTDEIIKVIIENFGKKEITLTLIEHIPGEWEMEESTHSFIKEDSETIKFNITLKPESKENVVLLHYHRRNVR